MRVHICELRTFLGWRKRLLHSANLHACRQVGPGKAVKSFQRDKKPFLVRRDAQRTNRSIKPHCLLERMVMREIELLDKIIADRGHVHVTSALWAIAVVRPATDR